MFDITLLQALILGVGLGISTYIFPPLAGVCAWLLSLVLIIFAFIFEVVVSFFLIIVLIIVFSNYTFAEFFSKLFDVFAVLGKYFIIFIIPVLVVISKYDYDFTTVTVKYRAKSPVNKLLNPTKDKDQK